MENVVNGTRFWQGISAFSAAVAAAAIGWVYTSSVELAATTQSVNDLRRELEREVVVERAWKEDEKRYDEGVKTDFRDLSDRISHLDDRVNELALRVPHNTETIIRDPGPH